MAAINGIDMVPRIVVRYFNALRGPLVIGFLYVLVKATILQLGAFQETYSDTGARDSRPLHHENHQAPPPSPRRNTLDVLSPPVIIMFAYMRGGSSFLGGTLQENPDVFYWYEPLWDAYNALASSGMFQYPLHTVMDKRENLRKMTEYESKFIRTQMKKMFTCQFEEMPPEILSSWTVGKSMNSLGDYFYCMKNHSALDKAWANCQKLMRKTCPNKVSVALQNKCHLYMEQTRLNYGRDIPGKFPKLVDYKRCISPVVTGIGNCIDQIKTSCESRPYKGAKVLRARMSFMEELVQDFPNLKVIHQLRDPRGTVTSRRDNHRSYSENIVEEARLLCIKMADDIKTRLAFERKYPGVFLATRYEDLATNPSETVHAIYRHLDIPMNKRVSSWIEGATSGGKDMGGFALTRRNSSATARAWTQKLSEEEKLGIDDVCKEVYRLAGYEQ